jgi:hypothetical protein
MGFKVGGYDTPGAIQQWLWGSGYSGIGPMLNNAPPIVRALMQQPGMKLDPTQYRAVGGYTPQFAEALNKALYPGMNFRTGEQSMGQLIGEPMQRTEMNPEVSPYSDYMTAQLTKNKLGADPMGQMKMLQMMGNEGQEKPDPIMTLAQALKALIGG